MRPTRSSPPPCARPTRRCCTTGPGGFYLARAQQVPGHDGVRDVLLGLLAAADEPIAGGRHKVFGHPDLAVDPADLDDRVAPAAGDGRRLRHRPGAAARPAHPLARRRPRRVQLRRRLAEPLDGAGRAERGDLHGAPGHVDAAAASCARTTGGGSACRRRPGGSPRRCRRGPGCATSSPTAPTPSACSTSPRTSPTGCARPAGRRCCTCARSATAATPAPTSRRRTARRPASVPTSTATRCWRPPACSSSTGRATADAIVERYLDGRAGRARRGGRARRRAAGWRRRPR